MRVILRWFASDQDMLKHESVDIQGYVSSEDYSVLYYSPKE